MGHTTTGVDRRRGNLFVSTWLSPGLYRFYKTIYDLCGLETVSKSLGLINQYDSDQHYHEKLNARMAFKIR